MRARQIAPKHVVFCFVVFVVLCCSSLLKWRNSLGSQYSYEVFALSGFCALVWASTY